MEIKESLKACCLFCRGVFTLREYFGIEGAQYSNHLCKESLQHGN